MLSSSAASAGHRFDAVGVVRKGQLRAGLVASRRGERPLIAGWVGRSREIVSTSTSGRSGDSVYPCASGWDVTAAVRCAFFITSPGDCLSRNREPDREPDRDPGWAARSIRLSAQSSTSFGILPRFRALWGRTRRRWCPNRRAIRAPAEAGRARRFLALSGVNTIGVRSRNPKISAVATHSRKRGPLATGPSGLRPTAASA